VRGEWHREPTIGQQHGVTLVATFDRPGEDVLPTLEWVKVVHRCSSFGSCAVGEPVIAELMTT
jgi:hypothetical protein